MLEKSQVESREHENDADIRYQPFPESVSEERQIQSDDNSDHRCHVKHDYQFAHFDILRRRRMSARARRSAWGIARQGQAPSGPIGVREEFPLSRDGRGSRASFVFGWSLCLNQI
jgi:hypothetical protein